MVLWDHFVSVQMTYRIEYSFRNKTALLNEPASVLTHCALGQIISAPCSSVCRFPTSYT